MGAHPSAQGEPVLHQTRRECSKGHSLTRQQLSCRQGYVHTRSCVVCTRIIPRKVARYKCCEQCDESCAMYEVCSICFEQQGRGTPINVLPLQPHCAGFEKPLIPEELERKEAIEKYAMEGLEAHGFSREGKEPVAPAPGKDRLWNYFQKKGPEKETLRVDNRFFSGYNYSELDFKKPVHGILVDFKADSMQMGMLIERLEANKQQYVFIGNPLPFNSGWHFTSLNDFEDEETQGKLNPTWKDIRIWHRVNFVPVLKDGKPALVPKEVFNDKDKEVGAILIDATFKMSHIYCLGGLMAGTLIANVVREGTPANELIQKHMLLGATFATVGHGLGVLVASGTKTNSLFEGFSAATLEDQKTLMKVSKMIGTDDGVHEHKDSNGCKLISASEWGVSTCEKWFGKLGLAVHDGDSVIDRLRSFSKISNDIVFKLDFAKVMKSATTFAPPDPTKKLVAIFVDYKFDPVEALALVEAFERSGINFQFISHSTERGEKLGPNNIRPVASELIFGNAMYALHDSYFVAPTIPADKVSESTKFDAFAIAGGQGPFHMMGDQNIIRILDCVMDGRGVGAAVCHGPMVLIGSKFIKPESQQGPKLTSFNGAWIYFRDILNRHVTEKPGHVQQAEWEDCKLLTANSPASAEKWSQDLCEMISKG